MILQVGSSGRYVVLLQKALVHLGASISIDGAFGPGTQAAVMAFQKAAGLPVDGVVGPATEQALYSAVQGGGNLSPISPVVPIVPTVPGSPVVAPPSLVSGTGIIHGVDVYHLDAVNSWDEILAAGFVFGIVKSSQGTSADPKCEQYLPGAKAAGLLATFYHFMNYNVSGASQAKEAYAVGNGSGYVKTDMVPWCDWEYSDGHNPTSSEISIVRDFFDTMDGLVNRVTGVYCSDYIPRALGHPSWFTARPLWDARYGAAPVNSYVIHQYSGTGSVPGIGNAADVNIVNSSLADFKSWISKT